MPVDAEVPSPPLTVACSSMRQPLSMINSPKNRLKYSYHTHISVPYPSYPTMKEWRQLPLLTVPYNLSKFRINLVRFMNVRLGVDRLNKQV